jgi:hypothetical protein
MQGSGFGVKIITLFFAHLGAGTTQMSNVNFLEQRKTIIFSRIFTASNGDFIGDLSQQSRSSTKNFSISNFFCQKFKRNVSNTASCE